MCDFKKGGETFLKWPRIHFMSRNRLHRLFSKCFAIFCAEKTKRTKRFERFLGFFFSVGHNCLPPLFFTLSSDSHGVFCVVLTGWSLIARAHRAKKKKKHISGSVVSSCRVAVHPQNIQRSRLRRDSAHAARAIHCKYIKLSYFEPLHAYTSQKLLKTCTEKNTRSDPVRPAAPVGLIIAITLHACPELARPPRTCSPARSGSGALIPPSKSIANKPQYFHLKYLLLFRSTF